MVLGEGLPRGFAIRQGVIRGEVMIAKQILSKMWMLSYFTAILSASALVYFTGVFGVLVAFFLAFFLPHLWSRQRLGSTATRIPSCNDAYNTDYDGRYLPQVYPARHHYRQAFAEQIRS